SKVMAAAQNFVSVTRRPPDVEDYIDMLRRYRSWLIGPMFGGLVTAVVVAFLWPDTYVSQAVMRITPPTISQNLVPTVVNMQMQQRLQQMQQEILSRNSLSELITRPSLDLYRKERAKYPLEDIIQDMKNKAIKIQTVEIAGGGGERRYASAFTISFSYPDRFKAPPWMSLPTPTRAAPTSPPAIDRSTSSSTGSRPGTSGSWAWRPKSGGNSAGKKTFRTVQPSPS